MQMTRCMASKRNDLCRLGYVLRIYIDSSRRVGIPQSIPFQHLLAYCLLTMFLYKPAIKASSKACSDGSVTHRALQSRRDDVVRQMAMILYNSIVHTSVQRVFEQEQH